MMKPWILFASVALLIAGCANSGKSPVPEDYAPKSQAEGDTSVATRARLHTELAANYFSIANYSVALQETAEALRADPNYVPAFNVQALIYMALRDDAAAEQNFQQALRRAPGDSDANHNYGQFLCQHKREQDADKYFMAALRNPLYATPEKTWVNAGVCAKQRGDLVKAEEYFNQALKLRPADAQALSGLAEIAYKRGDVSAAKAYLNRLPRDAPLTAERLWLALRVERKLGDRSAEASYGFQLRRNFPDSREVQALKAGQYE